MKFVSQNSGFSDDQVQKNLRLKNNPALRFGKWVRDFNKQEQKQRAAEAEYYPAPEVGFGNTITHTFLGDADDEPGSSLDYTA